jgi:hypothetical protein
MDLASLTDRATAVAERGPSTPTVARLGLGAMVFLAGVHKLLALVAVLDGGLFVDVLVRDVGLAALAWAVTLDALHSGDTLSGLGVADGGDTR